MLISGVRTAWSRFLSDGVLILGVQAAPPATQALLSRDTNRQPAAAPPPGKKPLRPAAPSQQQNSKLIADDDDAALQVKYNLLCMVDGMMTLIMP